MDLNILSNEYNRPEPQKVLLDTETGSIVDPNDPMNKIRIASKMMNVAIKDPNPKCKKCYGRGYVSVKVDTKEPVPCLCIFEKKDQVLNFPIKYNREQRRKMEKQQRSILNKIRK